MATKRKHETLSLTTKMEILRKLDSGGTQKDLALEYNVGRATIYDINKNRMRIEHYVKIADSTTTSRLTLKTGKFRRMEDALHAWFLKEHSITVLTADKIKQKALEIHERLYKNTEFKASDGWLLKFKARYGIKSQDIGQNVAEKTKNNYSKTPYLVPEESDIDSSKTRNEEITNDSSQCCEVIWVEDDDTVTPPNKLIKNKDALSAVDIGIQWAEENNESKKTLYMLKKLKGKIINKMSQHYKLI